MTAQCQALYISDGRRCEEVATSSNGLFCQLHARQCFGLYKGYKTRNIQLDNLAANPPAVLQNVPLHEVDLSQLGDEHVLHECLEYLQRRYALLDRVIRARRLYTSRFYALQLDFGHENFVNQLSAQRTPLLRSIQRFVKRLAEVLYEKQKWFEWVRTLENQEEQERDAEKKKIKQEAALFKRYTRSLEARAKRLRNQEEEKLQDEYLDKAWQEMQDASGVLDEQAIKDSWDPIEDDIEEERGDYLTLLLHFLWQSATDDETIEDKRSTESNGYIQDVSTAGRSMTAEVDTEAESSTTTALKSKNARKRARQKANVKANSQPNARDASSSTNQPGAAHVESMAEMRQRLQASRQIGDLRNNPEGGPDQEPRGESPQSSPIEPTEIEQLLSEVTEIKQLIFCRLILAHATLLPIALRSSSIDEFLKDGEVSNSELRDLCLKMEQPSSQEIRDACADLKREEGEAGIDDEDEYDGEAGEAPKPGAMRLVRPRIPPSFQTKRERLIRGRRLPDENAGHGRLVNFGVIDDENQHRIKKIRIKVCGKNIYYYPSGKAMSRGGWFQFAAIAKDCRLEDAATLCRSWDEFYELIVLTIYNYFPTKEWRSFLGGLDNWKLFELGFFPYFKFRNAERYTLRLQTTRGHVGPRQHDAMESRNFICGQMKRNDPITRRFIQYVALQSGQMVMFVRDVKTGEVLAQPPDEEMWLLRKKSGFGRANRNAWEVVKTVGTDFFEEVDKQRQWSLSFKDYYEITIWDLEAGTPFSDLYNNIEAALFKAHRVQHGSELYKPAESILRSITMNDDTSRAYDLKPGSDQKSLWDVLTDPRTKFHLIEKNEDGSLLDLPEEWLYNEGDKLEDAILFPAEQLPAIETPSATTTIDQPAEKDSRSKGYTRETVIPLQQRKIHVFETQGPDINKFILDLDSDDDISEEEAAIRADKLRAKVREHGEDYKEDNEIEVDLDEETDEGDFGTLTDSQAAALDEMITAMQKWRGLEFDDDDWGSDDEADEDEESAQKKRQTLKKIVRNDQHINMGDDWDMFIDRERALAFKDCWHRAELEIGAQDRWSAFQSLLAILNNLLEADLDYREHHLRIEGWAYNLATRLDLDRASPRRIIKDARLATGFVYLCFGGIHDDAFRTGPLSRYQSSLLFNQEERARNPPNRRSLMSNKTRPSSHFVEWDQRKHTQPRYLDEWNLVLRPILATLYREGIIYSSYEADAAGPAVCLTEPDRAGQPDLYFDWRDQVRLMDVSISDPASVQPLLDQAKRFAASNVFARFSVLRVWSAPHFWPLMLGMENRDATSFVDGVNRTWEWKFIPKDRPFSEWSMHKAVSDRIKAVGYFSSEKCSTKGNVVAKLDTILVMGRDVESCQILTTAATFAIITRPWRLEVDPWKSWYNVDVDFLQRLDRRWWE